MSCSLSPEFDISHCCLKHDIDYSKGIDKGTADRRFYSCMRLQRGRNSIIAKIYYLAVRLFGLPFYLKAIYKLHNK